MSSTLKPIKVYGKAGPNPPKVIMILEELGLPYEIDNVAFADVKKPEYLAVNPNGRLPTLIDHKNADFAVWCAYMLPLLPIWLSDAILLP